MPSQPTAGGEVKLLPRSVPLGKFKGQLRAQGSHVASCPAGSQPSQPAFFFWFIDLSFSIRKMEVVVVVVMWI